MLIGTSQLPKLNADRYGLANGELLLAADLEVPVTNLIVEEILAVVDLPENFVASTPCFRARAGIAGRKPAG